MSWQLFVFVSIIYSLETEKMASNFVQMLSKI